MIACTSQTSRCATEKLKYKGHLRAVVPADLTLFQSTSPEASPFCTVSFSASLPIKAIFCFDIISARKPNQPFSFLDNICPACLRADPPCPASHAAGFPKGCGTASSSLSWCFSYLPGTDSCGKESSWLCHPHCSELTHTEVINWTIKSQLWAETWQRRFWGKVCV